ncbi:MAG: hypothetical protein EP329_03700 [Deltaproteobacteria bacterium]|nr:MAG: hypothetical protein EP329_03700 [Deltaproteobacteria bacterium]
MNKHLVLLLALGALASCSSIDDPNESRPLATIRGYLTAGEGAPPTGEVRVALVWMNSLAQHGSFGHADLRVVQEVVVQPAFPASFELEIDALPDEAIMLPLEESVLSAVGELPADSQGIKLALGGLIAYEDVNGNGQLDLVDPGADAIDRVVAASSNLAVMYLEGGTLPLGDLVTGELQRGYNLLDVPSCWFDPSAGGFCTETITVLPGDTEVALALSASPKLSHMMCQSYAPDPGPNVRLPGEGPPPVDACLYGAAAIEVLEGCETTEGLCISGRHCTYRTWTFPEDEAGRIAWPCSFQQTHCDPFPSLAEDGCPAGLVATDAPPEAPADERDVWCLPVECTWDELWCHPESVANPCPPEGLVTLIDLEEEYGIPDELGIRALAVTSEHVVWQEQERLWDAVLACPDLSCPPQLRNRFRRVVKGGGTPELLRESDGPAYMWGVEGTRLYRQDFVFGEKIDTWWPWIPTQVCAVDLAGAADEACVTIGEAVVAVLPEQDAIVYRGDTRGTPQDTAGPAELWRRPIAGAGAPVRLATRFDGDRSWLLGPEPLVDGQLCWVESGNTRTLVQAPWDGSGDATTLFVVPEDPLGWVVGALDGHVYVYDMLGDASASLYRVAMDTGVVAPVLVETDVDGYAITADGLFFRDVSRGVIGRAALDGSGVETLVADPNLHPSHGAVLLVPDGDRLFWASPTSAGAYRIQSVPLTTP